MYKGDVVSKKNIDISSKDALEIPTDGEKDFPLLQINDQYYVFDDLVLDSETKSRLEYIVAENQNAKRLLSFGLNPKQKILFCGLPGTGKTLSAKIISCTLGYPLVHVMFDSIISSFLGQTATNLRKIFNFIENGTYVVLFDEFDIIGKKRDDEQEHGEVKRVVNNFMQMLDSYNGTSVIIAATNHAHLLDMAVWRRFDEALLFKLPTSIQRKELFQKYLGVLRKNIDFNMMDLVKKTDTYSASDIATICKDALRKNVIENRSNIDKQDLFWAINEQKRRKSIILSET